MTKVLMFGTFDVLHPGHLHIIRQAQKYGDEVYVVIALDETVKKVKGRAPLHDQEERREQVQEIPGVTQAMLGYPDDKYRVLEEIDPDVILLGYDQDAFVDKLKPALKERGIECDIVRLKPYKEDKFKSSKIKEKYGM